MPEVIRGKDALVVGKAQQNTDLLKKKDFYQDTYTLYTTINYTV